jgi:Fic family protein
LEHGLTVAKKPLKDHLEAIGHQEAILYLFDVINRSEAISERLIKDIHAIILRKIEPEIAGRYLSCQVAITGADHQPPDYIHVPDEMAGLIHWYENQGISLHPVERAGILHAEFVRIQPFEDGNGRTARLLLNLDLMRSGYVPVIIRTEDRLDYYQALDVYGTDRNVKPFVSMVVKSELAALEYLIQFLQ